VSSGTSRDRQKPAYGLDRDAIIADLTNEVPQWIFSAYGPGRQAPAQLFGGPIREQSFEEMRMHFYLGLATGNPQQAVCIHVKH
jgi:nucleoporin NUP42